MTTEEILERIGDNYEEELLKADGFDDAIVGVVEGAGRKTVICYDYDLCVEVLMKSSDMDKAEAQEFLDFNTVDAHVGDYTPMFLHNWRRDDAA